MNNIVIAIDGPAGSGKSTIAKLLAKKLNIEYIDTGAMYRAITLKFLSNNIDLSDKEKVLQILENTKIDFKDKHIFLDDKIVDNEIRKNYISKNVSAIAKIKEVRLKLVKIQRFIAINKSIVMDGRDVGSYVLPNANYKFYITASPEERGLRRYKELKEKKENVILNKIIEEIKNRDRIDSTRAFSPLIKSDDAIIIDTTNKSIEIVLKEVIDHIKEVK
ncbi:(d)CMP kinase [Clostridiisalibacter paucivorans]|uniref:(d)CMP kinase n=1 Tax=Clostridiisalibacter paucivorans TaxID=408753 RepID=UPI00047AAE20|nr:(d)CMP kinase [Clostridiisalibacter paucivorans]